MNHHWYIRICIVSLALFRIVICICFLCVLSLIGCALCIFMFCFFLFFFFLFIICSSCLTKLFIIYWKHFFSVSSNCNKNKQLKYTTTKTYCNHNQLEWRHRSYRQPQSLRDLSSVHPTQFRGRQRGCAHGSSKVSFHIHTIYTYIHILALECACASFSCQPTINTRLGTIFRSIYAYS